MIIEYIQFCVNDFAEYSAERRGILTTYEKVKQLSKQKRIPFYALEIGAKLSPGSISHWKRVSPSAKSLKRVAVLLGVMADDLIGDDYAD